MADEEVTNDQQSDAGSTGQDQNAEASAPESEGTAPDSEESGAEVAPDAEANAETDDKAETPESGAAEQLATDALNAARKAVACLDEELDTDQATESEPIDAQSPAATAPTPGETGSLTGSRMGSGVTSQPTPFTPEQLMNLASVEGGEGIDILSDVDLTVKIELGRTKMLVEDVLKLSDGAVVELDKLAGDPVDIYVNDRHVARGEVLILNDNFCVRVSEILEATIEER